MNKNPSTSPKPTRNQLLAVYEHAPIGIVECSPEGRLTYVNEEYCRIMGYPKDELLIRSIKDITHQEDFAKEQKLYQQLISGTIPSYEVDKRKIRKDGEVIWVQVIRSSLRYTEEDTLYTVGIVQGINEERRADAKIKFQAYLLENVHDAIIATSNELEITSWNRGAEELYGWTAEEVLGRHIIEITQSELSKEERTSVRDQISNGNEAIVETIHHHKDGHTIYVEARGAILHNEYGQSVGFVTAIRDISRRKQAEDALQKLNSELENRVKERTAELRKLSRRIVEVQEEERRAFARELHDRVGQILSALNLDLHMVKDQLAGEAEEHIKSKVEDSMELVAEATALVRGLLTELRSAILDDEGLQAALQEYIAQYTARYGVDVYLDTSIPSNLRLKPGLEITLLRIAQEALTNVARYAKTTEATVLLRLENDIIYLTIADKGIGIDASKSDANRIGHGQKIMLERAQAYGGTVNIESSKENGTRVKAVIPL